MEKNKENVLVAGATGTTGKKIINLLNQSQYFNPIAMVRKEEQRAQFESKNIETVLGDLEENLYHATENIDRVVFAAGSGGKKVIEVDQEGAKRLIDASKKNHVKKFVMLSSMGADQPAQAGDLKDYMQAKANADDYLRISTLDYAIVRPGELTNNAGIGKINLGDNLDKSGSISRDDVAQTLVRSLNDGAAHNRTFEILTGEELIGQAMDKVAKRD
ncbi:putative sugar epimerase YhfK [Kordia antarctica]|uniref:Putative sugar epimerase YhfK n=1 Tax=Kordia antarctica TaxID=1218801 RepID=A0A7L4ZEE7_9FLAO|nr:SDR family oxidoreductase [Kordia antarctica]QHI35108.1 putative sugar epimerase YhfK [Kordia antarctica]